MNVNNISIALILRIKRLYPSFSKETKIKIITNIIKQKSDSSDIDSLTLLQDIISEKFLWSETPEGHIYWENLYNLLNKQNYV